MLHSLLLWINFAGGGDDTFYSARDGRLGCLGCWAVVEGRCAHHSSTGTCEGLAVMNNAAVHVPVKVFAWTCVFYVIYLSI